MIEFPEPGFQIKQDKDKELIFDMVRKQWLVLTNEEWVRQNFIQYLVQIMKYPSELIAVEKEIRLGELKKRYDLLVFNKEYKPWMLIECKAQNIDLDENVIRQLLTYHITMPSSYLVITNGNYTFGWERSEGELKDIDQLPSWL